MTDQPQRTDRLLRACNWILADAKASLDYADQVLVSREVIGELREALRLAVLRRVDEEVASAELQEALQSRHLTDYVESRIRRAIILLRGEAVP